MGFGMQLLQAAPQIITALANAANGQQANAPSAAAQATIAANSSVQSPGNEKDQELEKDRKYLVNLFKEHHGFIKTEDVKRLIDSDPVMNKAYARLVAEGFVWDDPMFGANWHKDPRSILNDWGPDHQFNSRSELDAAIEKAYKGL